MTSLPSFDRAAAAVSRVVSAVQPDQWELPTACTSWNVRAVFEHLVHGNLRTAAWARGEPPPESPPPWDDAPEVFARSLSVLREALADPGLPGRTVHVPFGDVPGAMLVPIRVNELLVHGWDIADATGQSTDLEPDLAEEALSSWAARFGDAPRPPGGPFGPPVPAPAGASAADRLAAFLGRRSVRAPDDAETFR
ncbi:TIGR03086 family metal-binding protein [Amycolatopsis viridis]|uniref:Uncharacterized protein (TIGR03086 family) n=1 Tax=Amycolatopsis viridis TaxID=185678 RepID=A0ABX0SRL2_9PSEU|nr:TIGR03086 family metal-binding protein [Amycolatopsis viridis]NIH79607.1 uncharacterized protein (TIGR03086 family) [Amycolatopsis viridis]